MKYYRLAADHGLAPAQYNLGVMYGNGQGVPQDYVEAYKWLSLAPPLMMMLSLPKPSTLLP